MKIRGLALLAVLSVGLALHCSRPPEGPGTSYPCGVWGVACRNGACCPWGHICGEPGYGAFQRCPDGMCCYDGDPMYGRALDGGITAIPQKRP